MSGPGSSVSVGDVVRLRSGGAVMTVIWVTEIGGRRVQCAWRAGEERRFAWFPQELLELVHAPTHGESPARARDVGVAPVATRSPQGGPAPRWRLQPIASRAASPCERSVPTSIEVRLRETETSIEARLRDAAAESPCASGRANARATLRRVKRIIGPA